MAEFWTRFEEMVRSYLPDWQYRLEGPEVEAALLTALGEMLAATEEGLRCLPEKHLREYLRGFGFVRRPGMAAHAYAALYAPRAAAVAKGTLFYRNGDGRRLWEAVEDGWAEPACLTEHLLTGQGKMIRLPLPAEEKPCPLFEFRTPGIQHREARFFHRCALASPSGCSVILRLDGASEALLGSLARAAWSLICGDREQSLPSPVPEGNGLRFHLPAALENSALIVRAGDCPLPPLDPIHRALFRTERPACPPAAAATDAGLVQGGSWLPFGERLSLWNCCYLSCPEAFALRGGEAVITWTRSFRSLEDRAPELVREAGYRLVMRRLPPPPPSVRDVYAQAVVWEYWDGRTWRPIPGTETYHGLFSAEGSDGRPERMEVRFPWPEDAAPCTVLGVEGMWLRWRLCACEGAGWLPACHHVPEVTGLRAAARLSGAEADVSHRSGLEEDFRPVPGDRKILFPNFLPEGERWWLGFDLAPGGEQASLYIALDGRTQSIPLSAWEARPDGGERPLELRDDTDGLAHSGRITLGGVRGDRTVRFGTQRWWICLKQEPDGGAPRGRRPRLIRVESGAVLLRAVDADGCSAGDRFLPLQGGTVSASALTESFGGAAEETDQELTVRAQRERHNQERVVSVLDAEEMICGSIRDVVRTCCLRVGDAVQVAVLMRNTTHHAQAFQLRRGEVLRLLERRSALPALGMDIQVREPNFYLIHVMAWVRPGPETGIEEVRRLMRRALDRFLDPVSGHFDGTGWQMGRLPAASQLRACLRDAVPDTLLVQLIPTVTAPDGSERELVSVRDPFSLPAGGVYTIREAVKGGVSD